MTTSHNRVSILRCEPYIIDNSGCDENYYGSRYPFPVTVWRVFVDSTCIAQKALPFAPGDSVIELSANECLPYLSEGSDYVLVRQSGERIIWFRVANYYWTTLVQEFSHVDNAYCFEATQYIEAITKAKPVFESVLKRQSKFSALYQMIFGSWLRKAKGERADESILPPVITSKEIQAFLQKVFPRDLDLPLYRIPEREGDTRGEKLFRQVWNVISSGEMRISDAPEKVAEIHIGFDTREFRECIWQVGRVGDDVAILFLAEPHFPVWVGGFKGAFKAEDALLTATL